jgi:DNA-binding LytR/AlgR family response regulator
MTDIISNTTEHFQIKCLIVDDEENAIDGIVDYLKELNNFQIIDTCFSAIEAMEVLNNNTIDLLFLDINMPRLSGLEFLESLKNPPIVILTTAYSEFALDAFRLNVADYLLKPYTFQRFFQATQKSVELFKSQRLSNDTSIDKSMDMFIRQGDSFQKINCNDILIIEAMQNYLKIYLKNNKFVIHQTMSTIEEILPKDIFFRIHNSYIVNVNHIESVGKTKLIINRKEIPISKYRKEAFMNSVVYKKLISK